MMKAQTRLHLLLVTLMLIIVCVLGIPAADSQNHCAYPSLLNSTSDQLQDGLGKGCFTSVDLVKAYTERIREVNSTLHVVLEINPDATQIAQVFDEERKHGSLRGAKSTRPLHGLPILVKDAIGTDDKMETAAGSYAIVGAKVPEDSTVVAKLRQNGAIILGKTSLSQWYNLRSTNSSEGWNARGGQSYGAYYPEQNPSGSSSGSAVAADLGLALAALGTETNGSILLPGERNNVVGIKPTVGLTSRHMVIPVSGGEDTVGTLARTVKDAAKMLQAIVSQDPKDNYTLASPYASGFPDYVAACQVSGLQGKRIGVPTNVLNHLSGPESDVIGSVFKKAVSEISEAGATIVDGANFTAYEESLTSKIPSAVTGIGFLSNLPRYLASLKSNPNNIHSLADIRHFTQTVQPRLEEYPSRNTGVWDLILSMELNTSSPEYWTMHQQALQLGGEGGIIGALERHNLDAVLLPTSLAASIPSIVGTPVITVPLGAWPNGTEVQRDNQGDSVERAPGVPFGISFLGNKWSEEGLIAMAFAFEQHAGARETIQSRYIVPKTEVEIFRD